jgi:MFS family permease
VQSEGPSAFSLSTPLIVALSVLALGVMWLVGRELRKIPAKLHVLMFTAFLDMVGVLMVIPLLPFYAERLGAGGFEVGMLVSSFAVAQLLSAPLWGRFSDRFGRRPTLMVAMAASAIAYVIFGFADSLFTLFLSRIVQGLGGGTVGVIQAYVADATPPKDRARSLGWLSAATNLGVALGPVLGSTAVVLGRKPLGFGEYTVTIGAPAPGLLAAFLMGLNLVFAWVYLRESKEEHDQTAPKARTSRQAVARVITHSGEPASRLIWTYAIAMGAFNGVTAILALYLSRRFGVTERTIGYFFMYIGVISVLTRVLLLGRMVDWLGEPRLSRVGMVVLSSGLAGIALAWSVPTLAIAVALIPLGTAFTFPCVTAMLSRVISARERGLYMGVQQTFGGVARVAFPVVAGFLFDAVGIRWPFWVSAALVLGTIFLGVGMEEATARAEAPAA